MQLTVLGSGSPEPSARRASSGYLLEVGGDRILFDCGGGVFDNLIRSGRMPADITHLFFTHLHSDHMLDYARLVHAAWDAGGTSMPVWGPPPIRRITEGYFGREGVLAHDLVARTELAHSQQVWVARGGTLPRPWPEPVVTEIEPGFEYRGNGWLLRSCEVPHAQPALTCIAFAVEHDGKKFVYSGDAALCDALAELAQGADTLLHWCYRLSSDDVHRAIADYAPTPVQIAAMAREAQVRRLLLTHFRNHMDSDEGHASAARELADNFPGPAAVVEDLQTYDI